MNSSEQVSEFLSQLQGKVVSGLQAEEPAGSFEKDHWSYSNGAGGGCACVVEGGDVFERGGVNFANVQGQQLPGAASQRKPELAGASFRAMGLSLVVHPRNPHCPTAHANLRYLEAFPQEGPTVWWFGGGFDLTPHYGYVEDAVHWHKQAYAACEPFGAHVYPKCKEWCDDYFHIVHRGHRRGIGGLFFDDWQEGGFESAFQFVQSVGDYFLPAYLPIIQKRKNTPHTAEQIYWQRLRRGRYVEFNLVYDRGTLFGLQSGGRTESILMSMPPHVCWTYDYKPKPGSAEAALETDFLQPVGWLNLTQKDQDNE